MDKFTVMSQEAFRLAQSRAEELGHQEVRGQGSRAPHLQMDGGDVEREGCQSPDGRRS